MNNHEPKHPHHDLDYDHDADGGLGGALPLKRNSAIPASKIKFTLSNQFIKEGDGGGAGAGGGGSGSAAGGGGWGNSSTIRVCEYCGHEFSSGKAWGGHKRHCSKKNGNLKLPKSKSKSIKVSDLVDERRNTIKSGEVIIQNGKPTCRLCGNNFVKIKSLFDHMRVHTDNDWKGMEIDSNQELKTCVNLMDSLSAWTKTDKRGRVIITDPIPLAANDLMMLSRDTRYLCKPSNQKIMQISGEESDDESGDSDDDEQQCGKNLDESSESDGKAMPIGNSFQCEICERTFPTGQALGGHKRCHWKGHTSTTPAEESALQKDDNQVDGSNAASTGEVSREMGKASGRLDFDLNKPAHGEE